MKNQRKKLEKGKLSTGAKKDAVGALDKPRVSLIPKNALWSMAGAFTYGETHYSAHNWRKGIPISYLCDSAIRHITQFLDGENIDAPSKNLHLGNAMANLAMAIEMLNSKPEMDDRYKDENTTPSTK